MPLFIEVLQRAAGLPTALEAAPAPASDGWAECAPGECPLDLTVGDEVRRGALSGTIIRVDTKITEFPLLVESDSGRRRWYSPAYLTAYRRSAP